MRTNGQISEPASGITLPEVLVTRRETVHRLRASQPGVNQPTQDTVVGSNSGGIGQPVDPIDIRPPVISS